jgi:hypothetical protein
MRIIGNRGDARFRERLPLAGPVWPLGIRTGLFADSSLPIGNQNSVVAPRRRDR